MPSTWGKLAPEVESLGALEMTPAEKRLQTIKKRQSAHHAKTTQARMEFYRAVRRAVKAALRKRLTASELKIYAIASVAAETASWQLSSAVRKSAPMVSTAPRPKSRH
jgi:hypothetical protein